MWLRDKLHDVRTMRVLLPAAEAIAGGMGEPAAGPEHLLLAALDLPDGSARRAFARVGADPDALRAAIARQHADALEAVGVDAPDAALDDRLPPPPAPPRGPLRTTDGAHGVFRSVVARVRADRSRLHGAWIVLVVAEARHGVAARALRLLGLDRDALRAAAADEIAAADLV